jgi:hypothetical protein
MGPDPLKAEQSFTASARRRSLGQISSIGVFSKNAAIFFCFFAIAFVHADDRVGRRTYTDWSKRASLQRLVHTLEKNLKIKKPEDWYRLTFKDAKDAGARGLMNRLGGTEFLIRKLSEEGLIEAPSGGWNFANVREVDPSNLGRFRIAQGRSWDRHEKVQQLVDKMKAQKGLTKAEYWYLVSYHDFVAAGGNGFLRRIGGSPKKGIQLLGEKGFIPIPNGGWKDELFGARVDWGNESQRKKLVERILAKSKIKRPEDWYSVGVSDFRNAEGETFLGRFDGQRVRAAVLDLSSSGLISPPEGGWDPNAFGLRTSRWSQSSERKKLVASIKRALKITKPEHWYAVNRQAFCKAGGEGFVDEHKTASDAVLFLAEMGDIVSPKGGWEIARFRRVRKWDTDRDLRGLVEAMKEKFGFEKPEDWYQASTAQFTDAGGIGLLVRHGGSLSAAVQALSKAGFIPAPEWGWKEHQFGSRKDWSIKDHRSGLVDQIIKNLNIGDPSDWYRVSSADFAAAGGGSFLQKNGGLEQSILMLSEEGLIKPPLGGWDEEQFRTPVDWNVRENRQQLVDKLVAKLNLKKPEDWYRVSSEDFRELGITGFLGRHKSPKRAILSLSAEGLIQPPKDGWNDKEFHKGLKGQKLLASFAEKVLGKSAIFNDRRTHGVRNPRTNMPLEADISFPDLKIAIEYQGYRHTEDEKTIARDEVKRKQFPKNGWLLIEVWEGSWRRNEEYVRNLLHEKSSLHPDPQMVGKLQSIGLCNRSLGMLKAQPRNLP